jgi:receptor polysaccharide phosphotransferase wefC
MYLTAPVEPTDFFSEDGLPKYVTALAPITTERYGTGHFQMNDMGIITSHFSKEEIFKNGHFFSFKHGIKQLIKTLLYGTTKFICGFWESHLPYPLLKSTMDLVWEKEKAVLEGTSASRFRSPSDTNVWLFKYWQIASGQYAIGNPKLGGLFSLDNAGPDFWKLLNSGRYQIMCINDGHNIQDEDQVMTDFVKAMDQLLPDKSSFEI